jgi:hypothetical protein
MGAQLGGVHPQIKLLETMRDRLSRKNIVPCSPQLAEQKRLDADSRSLFNGSLRSCDAAYLNAFFDIPMSNFGRRVD